MYHVKAALAAIERLRVERGEHIAVIVSGTIEAMGTMLAGQTAEAFTASLLHADLLGIGLNCATGPEFMTDHLRTIHQMSPFRISCYPNAGLPNSEGKFGETPESLAGFNLPATVSGTSATMAMSVVESVDPSWSWMLTTMV